MKLFAFDGGKDIGWLYVRANHLLDAFKIFKSLSFYDLLYNDNVTKETEGLFKIFDKEKDYFVFNFMNECVGLNLYVDKNILSDAIIKKNNLNHSNFKYYKKMKFKEVA